MAALVDSMAHREDIIGTPWHKDSTAVFQDQSPEEWASSAGIGWTVSSRIPRIKLSPDSDEMVAVPDYFFITRDSDNRVYQCVTDRYATVQNIEILESFRRWSDTAAVEICSVGALKDGAVIFAVAKTGKSFKIKGEDATDLYLTFARSHDGTLANDIWTTAICTVCNNTLNMARQDQKNGSVKKKSTKNYNPTAHMSEAERRLGYSIESFEFLHETAEMLSERPADFNGSLVKEFLVNLTSPAELKKLIPAFTIGAAESLVTDETLGRVAVKIHDAMLTGPGQELAVRQNTWWGVLNGVTHYADHLANGTKSSDARATSAMFGGGAALKERALELVPAYAML